MDGAAAEIPPPGINPTIDESTESRIYGLPEAATQLNQKQFVNPSIRKFVNCMIQSRSKSRSGRVTGSRFASRKASSKRLASASSRPRLRLLEHRLASFVLGLQNARRLVELGFVRPLRLAVRHDAPKIRIHDKCGLAAGTNHLDLALQLRHGTILVEPNAHPSRRDLQHPPVPRTRRSHQSESNCRRHSSDRSRHHRAAGSGGRESEVGGTRRGAGRTARNGMGHGPGTAAASRVFGNVMLSRLPILHHAQYDLSWKTCEPRCCQRVDIAVGSPLHLYTCTWGPHTWSADTRPLASCHSCMTAVWVSRRSSSATEWMRGLATQMLSQRLKSIDLRAHLRRRVHPASFSLCTWTTSTTRERWRLPGWNCLERLALLASDHLPLVAELTVEFS